MTLEIIGSTDKLIRFQVKINGTENGELSMGREEFTRFAELVCGKHYTITSDRMDKIQTKVPEEKPLPIRVTAGYDYKQKYADIETTVAS